jgi:hypothetical protein
MKPTSRQRAQALMELTRLKLRNDEEINKLRRYSAELQRRIKKLAAEK